MREQNLTVGLCARFKIASEATEGPAEARACVRAGEPGHLGAAQPEAPNDVRRSAALAGACIIALTRPIVRQA